MKGNRKKYYTAGWNGLIIDATLMTKFGFGIKYETGTYNVGCENSKRDTREYVGAREIRRLQSYEFMKIRTIVILNFDRFSQETFNYYTYV